MGSLTPAQVAEGRRILAALSARTNFNPITDTGPHDDIYFQSISCDEGDDGTSDLDLTPCSLGPIIVFL